MKNQVKFEHLISFWSLRYSRTFFKNLKMSKNASNKEILPTLSNCKMKCRIN